MLLQYQCMMSAYAVTAYFGAFFLTIHCPQSYTLTPHTGVQIIATARCSSLIYIWKCAISW